MKGVPGYDSAPMTANPGTTRPAMMRLAFIALAAALFLPRVVAGQDLASHGIWSIAEIPGMSRWIVIHDAETSKTTGLYHIEVIGRRDGDPAWRIIHLVPHMAITREALLESILEPLHSGAVYPEVFDDAYTAWQARNDGAGGSVCSSTVLECMAERSEEK